MPSNDADGEKDTDVVYSILTGSPFKLRPDDEKLAILKKGRPLFNLNIIKRDTSRNCNRAFHSSWYTIHKWLCGSENYNKLFCWPCLLMRPETSSWCSIGNDDTKRFMSLAVKHSRCKSHLKAICEYDETLSSFGLNPEFVNELKFKCEKEEGSVSDKTEPDDDLESTYFQETQEKEEITEVTSNCKVNETAAESSRNNDISNISGKITFKTWQEMCKNNFPVPKSRFFKDFHLFKWKRKIIKQEFQNARLTGEKLKYEIEVLKAKIEYYRALKKEVCTNNSPSMSKTSSDVLES